jgi:glycosyltransferase involved in cell wall biosynthesis
LIEAVGVVVPAHDEENLLPECLAAIRRAERALPGIPVHLVVAADTCSDRTAEIAREAGTAVVEIGARCVGAARAAGMREALHQTGQLDPACVWLATTDADSLVPADWLSAQLAYAAAGWDAVVGTVTVTDWSEHAPAVQIMFKQGYGTPGDNHPHVHGANLGFTARAYLAAGGFSPLPTAEDHAFVRSLAAADGRIIRTGQVSVVTSARRAARAPLGFGHLLTTYAETPAGLLRQCRRQVGVDPDHRVHALQLEHPPGGGVLDDHPQIRAHLDCPPVGADDGAHATGIAESRRRHVRDKHGRTAADRRQQRLTDAGAGRYVDLAGQRYHYPLGRRLSEEVLFRWHCHHLLWRGLGRRRMIIRCCLLVSPGKQPPSNPPLPASPGGPCADWNRRRVPGPGGGRGAHFSCCAAGAGAGARRSLNRFAAVRPRAVRRLNTAEFIAGSSR